MNIKLKSVKMEDDTGRSAKSKILTICMAGRDDDYMLDFNYRITTTINYFARSLERLGRLDDVEILVTDWGSHIPMAQTLNLSQEAARITRFIYVPLEIIRSSQDGKEDFHLAITQNVAIRRASGAYVLLLPADTLFSQHSMDSLIRLLKGKISLPIGLDHTFFVLPRIQVPWQFLERQPSLEEWDRYFLVSAKNKPIEPVSPYNGLGDYGGSMMHSSMWNNSRGLDEKFIGWGWHDVDIGLRITQNHPSISLSSIGIISYHMGHPPTGRRSSIVQIEYQRIYNINYQINGENWGIGDMDFNIESPPKKIDVTKTEESVFLKLSKKPKGSWNKSLNEICNELQNPDLCEYVKSGVTSFLQRGWEIQNKELNALFFIAWYSHSDFPRRYLEFAAERNPAAGIVVSGCPSVEIYIINTWEGILPQHAPTDFQFINDVSLHTGYFRFINGNISTSFNRLKDSFIGVFSFDLVLVKDNLLKENAIDYLCSILPYLTEGGALVFSSSTTDSFSSTWSEIQRRSPDFSYISCKDNKTGMILTGSTMDSQQVGSHIEEIAFDITWFEPHIKNFTEKTRWGKKRFLDVIYYFLSRVRKTYLLLIKSSPQP